MAGTPAMTMREIRIGLADQDGARHWSRGRCRCEASHGGAETALTMVPPPWDATRDGEAVNRG